MAELTAALLEELKRQTHNRCGYCHTTPRVTGQPLTVEHLHPVARGGGSSLDNLWLSCRNCNTYKGTQIEASDPQTSERVLLFNPRRQAWHEHFAWSGDGTQVVGLTACGRATVAALRLNHEEIVAARRLWVVVWAGILPWIEIALRSNQSAWIDSGTGTRFDLHPNALPTR